MAPECQERNAKSLIMVAIGMNKAAEEFMILDERTCEELASGKYRDQRRGTFGPSVPAAPPGPHAEGGQPGATRRSSGGEGHAAPDRSHHPANATASAERRQSPARRPWTRSQEKLALLYNEQGLRPAEIAGKLGISNHLVTQIVLAAKNRGKG